MLLLSFECWFIKKIEKRMLYTLYILCFNPSVVYPYIEFVYNQGNNHCRVSLASTTPFSLISVVYFVTSSMTRRAWKEVNWNVFTYRACWERKYLFSLVWTSDLFFSVERCQNLFFWLNIEGVIDLLIWFSASDTILMYVVI